MSTYDEILSHLILLLKYLYTNCLFLYYFLDYFNAYIIIGSV